MKVRSNSSEVVQVRSDSDADYSNEALQQIFEGTDAKLDDTELINKKSLVAKQNPLSLINQLVAKWKEHGKSLILNDCIETRDPKTMRAVWHVKVGLPEKDLFGKASHQ